MPEERLNTEPEQENPETPETTGERSERFVSDTQKIVRRHLENEDDVITDEDIRSVRVGMTPPLMDEPTEARFGNEEEKDTVEEEYLSTREDKEEPEANAGDTLTPWDTIDTDR